MNDFKKENYNEAKFLYGNYATRTSQYTDRWHNHHHWQTDFIISGETKVEFEKSAFNLRSGDIIMIPPGFTHRCVFDKQFMDNWSIKFYAGIQPITQQPSIIKNDFENIEIKRLLIKIFCRLSGVNDKPDTDIALDSLFFPESILVNQLLLALVKKNYTDEATALSEPLYVKKIKAYIRKHAGRKITVEEIARKIGYSKGHLSVLCKQELGIPLKTFIDQERFEIARKLLEYSEMNITEIADKLGFRDVFYFSKFFKRICGKSPKNSQK